MTDEGIPCLWMRGGTSKGAYFLASDLPTDPAARDAILLLVMGSPDRRQIDGIGGADPLTSKVAILSPSSRTDADVDYLFLQVFVDQPVVSAAQGCGNILAAVGPAAIERGLVVAQEGITSVRIHMVNTGEVARAEVETPNRRVRYSGGMAIDGVPGTAAPVRLMFDNIAGSANALWVNMANAINLGLSGIRGPSNYIVATAGAGVTAPATASYALAFGTDGAATITSTVLVGVDTTTCIVLGDHECACG